MISNLSSMSLPVKIENDDIEGSIMDEKIKESLNTPKKSTNNYASSSSSLLRIEKSDDQLRKNKLVVLAVRLSLVANIILLAVKLLAYLASNSKAILASFADSVVDLASQFVVFFCNWRMQHVDRRYPIGKTRLETISALIIACIMTFAAFQVVSTSAKELYDGFVSVIELIDIGKAENLEMSILLYVILSSAVVIKFLLYIFCHQLKNESDSTLVLSEDHLNDVISNTAAIVAAAISKLYWYVDPIGGIIISVYIILSWLHLAKKQIDKIIGIAAPPDFVEKMYSIANNYDNDVEVDFIRAYHFGNKYFVEVDIVMPGYKSIFESHDKALALQQLIEDDRNVERAFVHIDYTKRDIAEHKLDWSRHIPISKSEKSFKMKFRILKSRYIQEMTT